MTPTATVLDEAVAPPAAPTPSVPIDPIDRAPGWEPEPPARNAYATAKVALDFALALALLVLTGPVVLAMMALVKLTSRGPAIYTQVRLGRGGRHFTIYKLRTMRADAERGTGPQWSRPGDSRVTPLGRFLRATHLDELPQLINVLRGDMGLIGPRPERPEIAAQLERAIPRYRERLGIRPGVTGLAQVELPPDVELDCVRRKLARDVYYIHHAGPLLDLKILAGTAAGVLGVRAEWTCKVLRIPNGGAVEDAYHDLGVRADDPAASWMPA